METWERAENAYRETLDQYVAAMWGDVWKGPPKGLLHKELEKIHRLRAEADAAQDHYEKVTGQLRPR